MATDEKATLDVTQFVKPPDDDLICSICLGVARAAVETECGHLFCEECMNRWLEKSRTCPMDQQKIERAQVRPTRYVRNKIFNLVMKCTCGMTHTVRELDSHEKECINHRRKCDTCDIFVKKSLYEAHLVDQFGLHYDALVNETKQLRVELDKLRVVVNETKQLRRELDGLRVVENQQQSLVKQNKLLKEQMHQMKTEFQLLKSSLQSQAEEKTGVLMTEATTSRHFRNSNLLDGESAAKLMEFIGGKCQTRILYKASKDGFASRYFHRYCDEKGPTVTVIKRNGSEAIFGGYTPLNWKSDNKYHRDDQLRSFLFTMSDENGIANKYKLKQKGVGKAIYCRSGCGPTFGGGNDLRICPNSNTSVGSSTTPHSYEVPSKTTLCGQHNNYTITEIEVFSISN